MGRESLDMVRFDLGPLLQGQTRIAKHKSVFIFHPIALFGGQIAVNRKLMCYLHHSMEVIGKFLFFYLCIFKGR